MTREEDLVRSTTSAIAATIHDVPPLGLRSGPEVLIIGSGEPGHRPGSRRWGSRLVPVGAAVMVAAAAIALVALSASVPHGDGAQPGSTLPAGAALSSASVPEYYLAVTPAGRLVAGNTETGKTVAAIDAPQGLVFDAVTAASDDRTFIASAAPAPPSRGALGSAPIGAGADLGGHLYLVRLAPGTGQPSQLTPLAFTPPAGVLAVALSASGRELAVASATGASSAAPAYSVSVYSVPAGRLLHAWTTATDVFGKNSHLQALTWVDDDKGIMFATNTAAGDPGVTGPETVRRLDVTAGGSDLAADSHVAWSTTRGCGSPLIGGDGSTIVCVSVTGKSPSSSTMTATWLASPVTARTSPRTLYKVSMPYSTRQQIQSGATTLWVDPSGGTALIEELIVNPGNDSVSAHIGAISNGHFTPYPPVAGDPAAFPPILPSIAW
jgi:hypothetical protein